MLLKMASRDWITDKLLLLLVAIVVTIVGVVFSILYARSGLSPGMWLAACLVVGFIVAISRTRRANFSSPNFHVFFAVWLAVYVAGVGLAIAYLPWFAWVFVLVAILFLGNIAAYRFFGPPNRPTRRD
jgi:hypothetical protein